MSDQVVSKQKNFKSYLLTGKVSQYFLKKFEQYNHTFYVHDNDSIIIKYFDNLYLVRKDNFAKDFEQFNYKYLQSYLSGKISKSNFLTREEVESKKFMSQKKYGKSRMDSLYKYLLDFPSLGGEIKYPTNFIEAKQQFDDFNINIFYKIRERKQQLKIEDIPKEDYQVQDELYDYDSDYDSEYDKQEYNYLYKTKGNSKEKCRSKQVNIKKRNMLSKNNKLEELRKVAMPKVEKKKSSIKQIGLNERRIIQANNFKREHNRFKNKIFKEKKNYNSQNDNNLSIKNNPLFFIK